MTLGVRGLIHDRASNSVFLIRHTYVPGWQLPGGGVEVGETLGEALARELAEEGNIVLDRPAGAEIDAFQPPLQPPRPCRAST